jgi:hypothetical protein
MAIPSAVFGVCLRVGNCRSKVTAAAKSRDGLCALAGIERKEAFNFHAVRCDRVVKNVFERIQKQVLKQKDSEASIQ